MSADLAFGSVRARTSELDLNRRRVAVEPQIELSLFTPTHRERVVVLTEDEALELAQQAVKAVQIARRMVARS